jgi:hypothetical protein
VDVAQAEYFLRIAAKMLVDLYGAELASPLIKIPQNIAFPPKKLN